MGIFSYFFGKKNKNIKRKRIGVLHVIESDAATYILYHTETIDYDCCNIEVVRNGKIILEELISNKSDGAMGGESFTSIIRGSCDIVRDYIMTRGEFIIRDDRLL